MLTVDFETAGIAAGSRVLDIGCGSGRHSFAALRLGAEVVAADAGLEELIEVQSMRAAMEVAGELDRAGSSTLATDIREMPFADGSFDVVIAAEILEHVPADERALAECARVLKEGGMLVVTVPRTLPEALNWLLSRQYHDRPGGHVRIYRRRQLLARLARAGFFEVSREYRHGLHSPYWWLRCALGVDRPDRRVVSLYHRLLVHEIVHAPKSLQWLGYVLDPIIGKSAVYYLRLGVPSTTKRSD